ncbi:TIGR03792 family protein [Aureivirga sp. CE67]|uniref:TIGR03792 family protein n=1 Tax=Aureivirga sp. CE67 TaxID=1788983 RepID=UPI0018CA16BF|nr:TIGR03792 family protein [Aureivirga sp. CE67]
MKTYKILLGVVLLSFAIYSYTKISKESYLSKNSKDLNNSLISSPKTIDKKDDFRAVEVLVYQLEKPEHIKDFLKVDSIVWTPYLKKNNAYFSKRVVKPLDNDNQIAFILEWNSYKVWKEITPEQIEENEEVFRKQFKHPYEIHWIKEFEILDFNNK